MAETTDVSKRECSTETASKTCNTTDIAPSLIRNSPSNVLSDRTLPKKVIEKMPSPVTPLTKKLPGVGKIFSAAINNILIFFRKMFFRLQGGSRYRQVHYNTALIQALTGLEHKTGLSDHLSSIFFFALNAKPKLMVELGTRGGDSTSVLLAVASLTDAVLLSIDIRDCKQLNLPFSEHWSFIKADDVAFGLHGFGDWCVDHAIEPKIDLLFVDTSHEYEHTKMEIEVWSKHLSSNGTMIFHDTNLREGFYSRLDGSTGFGWDNKRGVIKAVEEFMGREYDENSIFDDLNNGFLIRHYPNSTGLTILKKFNRDQP